jgi:uncharacterized protein (DUF58 family)
MDNRTPPVQVRICSRLWPILTIAVFLIQILWPSRAWMVMLIVLGGGWGLAYFWTRSLARHLRLDRELRYGWAQVGDHLQERYTLTNTGWSPATWVEIEDHSNLPDYQVGRVTGIGPYSTLRWKTERICTRRGLYTLGPTHVRSGDPLSIYSVEMFLPESTILMVVPPVIPLPAIRIAPGGQVGEGRRSHQQAIETTVSVEGVHEYLPGEPLKAIHWPTSARRGKFFVRQFEHTPASDWWIFLDMASEAQVGYGFDSTEEDGVILAASLSHEGLEEGHTVGLAINSRIPVWLPPRRTADQRTAILRALAPVSAGEFALEKLLASQPGLRNGASLIVITPDVRAGWLRPLLALLRRGISPTVLLLDPSTYGGNEGAASVAGRLLEYGIPCHIVPHGLLDRPEARPGVQGVWEWRIGGLGKAVAVRKPAEMPWRRLG